MYTVIRTYNLIPGTVEEFIQDFQKSLVPILNRMPGLREYSLVEVAETEVVAISSFNSFADAKASAHQIAGWVAEHTDVFFQGFSKPMVGEIRVHSGPVYPPRTSHETPLQGVF